LKQKLVVHLCLGTARGVLPSAVQIDNLAFSIPSPEGRLTVPFHSVRFVKVDELFIWQAPNWLTKLDSAYWDGIEAEKAIDRGAKKASSRVRIRRKQPGGARRRRR
jgi:hypothetical protein